MGVLPLTLSCGVSREREPSPGLLTGAGGALSAGGPQGTTLLLCEDRTLDDVENGHDMLPGYGAERDPRVENWVATLSLEQLMLEMLGPDGHDENFNDVQRSLDVRLADGSVIRGYQYRNGPRGANLADPQVPDRPSDGFNYSTAFPAESVRGAAFDLELEWEIGEAIGDETMAAHDNLVRGPGVDLVRHPYWGRTQDAYGEDAYHVGRLGSAFTAGVQSHVSACAEHFVAYNIERGRESANSVVDEQTLREIYSRPFEMVVQDGGVACVLAAYNAVNGQSAYANAHLLRDILKGDVAHGGFGFRGFVITDALYQYGGWRSDDEFEDLAVNMASAGLDVQLPFNTIYAALPAAVAAGRIAPGVIQEAAGRILEQKARFETVLSTDPMGMGSSSSTLATDKTGSIATNPSHLALAARAEREGAVLLQNGSPAAPTLPIPSGVHSVAVIGAGVDFMLQSTTNPKSCPDSKTSCTFHFATDIALGDRGSNRINADPAQSVAPFAGIQATGAAHGVTVTQGTTAADAATADFVVVVVGLTPGDEGEEYTIKQGGDRQSLDLPADQNALVASVLALGKPTAVIVESGSIVNLPWLSDTNQNQATVWAGYGGMQAGVALGALLFGDENFSGKMPLAWPKESELPPFRGDGNDTVMDYFFGYRDYDRRRALGETVDLVFPFGQGMSYTTFAYSHASLPCTSVTPEAVLDVHVDVANTGAMDGDEVAFLFVEGPSLASEPRAVRELKGFDRLHLPRGSEQRVTLPLRIRDLRHWSGDSNGNWVLDPGEYRVLVGPRDAEDALLVAGAFTISD